MRIIEHRFVEVVPEKLEENIIYISIEHNTCLHLCFCGCNNEVVTPLSPHDWKLTYNGEHVSLSPSIGNWNFKCQSHYWVRENRVLWAKSWSSEEIEENRKDDQNEKKRYFKNKKKKWYSNLVDFIFS